MQRKPPEALIEVGRVAGSYGVRGWIKVQGPERALAQCRQWWIGGSDYPVEEIKQHSGTLLAKLAGLNDREAALKLKGSTVYVRRDAMPAPDEGHYYLTDLVGLEVVNEQGVVLGSVKRWMFNGAQDVMELECAGTPRLLPWVPTVVKKVDLQQRRIEVDWGADW